MFHYWCMKVNWIYDIKGNNEAPHVPLLGSIAEEMCVYVLSRI